MVNDPHKKTGPLGRFSQAPSALAPIEDDYFLQVDFPGSKPVLMPPTNMYPTLHQRPGNTDEYTTSATRFWCAVMLSQRPMMGWVS
jgi:hypothetical protein